VFTSVGNKVIPVVAVAFAVGAGTAVAGGQAPNTDADYTPFAAFTPLATSAECAVGPVVGDPFTLPSGYGQQVIVQEGDGGSINLFDMLTQNESGKDEGRYLYRTHETATNGQVTLTDLQTGVTEILAQRSDFERFDGIAWTPWGTLLAAEEVIIAAAKDPSVPQAVGGLVYEFFVDPDDPSELDPSREPITPGDGTTDNVQDGIRARPALGAKSHEGLRFDKQGYLYGIAETRGISGPAGQSGAVFRFVPDEKGDLSAGQLQALQTDDGLPGRGLYGSGRWIDLDQGAVQVNADAEAEAKGANQYERPEDVETGQSTGRDVNNGGNTLYVAITEGTHPPGDLGGVLAVDLSSQNKPFAYPYVGVDASKTTTPDFANPDNLALDREGNLVITEDTDTPPGGDIWIAARPTGRGGQPAATVQRFASLRDCAAEPTGVYFALDGTSEWTDGTPRAQSVGDETLFVNRQHAGNPELDQTVAIFPS
jgi:hypothetical protein